jgi:hypothetical protein
MPLVLLLSKAKGTKEGKGELNRTQILQMKQRRAKEDKREPRRQRETRRTNVSQRGQRRAKEDT